MSDLRQVYSHLLEYPELREYLYGGTDASRLRGKQRARLETVVEMLADTLEAGLFTTRQHPCTASDDEWHHYTRHILTTSPVVRQPVLDHVQWGPCFTYWHAQYRRVNGGPEHPTGPEFFEHSKQIPARAP